MSNGFEQGIRKVIPAVLVYLRSGDHILMLHRDSGRPGDDHSGKWNGLGGKCEIDESSLEAAQREVLEESGLSLPPEKFRSLGVLQFPNFKAHKNEDWLVFVFTAVLGENDRSAVRPKCNEGSLHWIPRAQLLELNLWPGDRHFLDYVINEQPFVGTLWYEGPDVRRVWIQRLV